MRTLPALLLAAFVTLVIVASAALATQFGGNDWPTPPTPDQATRLVTPTEAAGRATEKITSHETGRKSTEPGAYSDTRRESRSRSGRRAGGDGAASRGNSRRDGADGQRQRQGRGDRSGSTNGDGPGQTGEGTDTAPAPQTPAAPAPAPVDPIPPVAGVDPNGNDSQARPSDQPAVPPTPAPPADDGSDDEGSSGDGDRPHRPRGPIRHLLDHLLPKQ